MGSASHQDPPGSRGLIEHRSPSEDEPSPTGPRRAPEAQGPQRAVSGAAFVLGALLAWNGGNYLFFLIAGRVLGPVDYGLLAALLAAVVVVSVPCNALQMEVARQMAGSRPALARGVYRRAWWLALWVGPAVVAAVFIVLVGASTVWDLRLGPLAIALAAMAPMGVLYLALGALQGEQRFGGYAASLSLVGAPRPVILVPLLAIGLGIYAGLWATVGALVSAAALGAFLTRRDLLAQIPVPKQHSSAFGRGLFPIAVGLLGIAVLTNVDVIVAKASLSASEAGRFAAIAVLAKAVILVPLAASTVLLPRVAARTRDSAPAGELLALGVIAAVATGVAGAAIAFVAAEPIVEITFGSEFTESADLLAPFALASSTLGAMIVLLNHHVGRRTLLFAWATGALAIVYLAALAVFHDSAIEIIVVGGIVGLLGVAMHEVLYGRTDDGLLIGTGAFVHDVRKRTRRQPTR